MYCSDDINGIMLTCYVDANCYNWIQASLFSLIYVCCSSDMIQLDCYLSSWPAMVFCLFDTDICLLIDNVAWLLSIGNDTCLLSHVNFTVTLFPCVESSLVQGGGSVSSSELRVV